MLGVPHAEEADIRCSNLPHERAPHGLLSLCAVLAIP